MFYRLFILSVLTGSCNFFPSETKNVQINARAIFPRINFSTGKLIGYDTTVTKIVQKKEIVLYKIMYTYDTLKSDTVITDKLFHYVLYKIGDSFCYNYDSKKSINGQRVNLDSILKYEWFVQNKLYPMFSNINEVRMLSTYTSLNNDTLKEEYSLKSIANPEQSGLVFLEFCHSMKQLNFSLSKELDSIKKMKLYKFRTQMNPIKVNDSLTFDKFETMYDISISPKADKEINSYFEKFAKDSK